MENIADKAKAKCKRAVLVLPYAIYAGSYRYDEFFALSRRRFVPPNFAEMRHVLNIAQASNCESIIVIIQTWSNATGVAIALHARMVRDKPAAGTVLDILVQMLLQEAGQG